MEEIFKPLTQIEQHILHINKTLDGIKNTLEEIKQLVKLLKKYTDK